VLNRRPQRSFVLGYSLAFTKEERRQAMPSKVRLLGREIPAGGIVNRQIRAFHLAETPF
jgi:hypothetical protein